jgi:hypothetical protein
MPILEIIKNNHEAGYNQGIFANNLTRHDVYQCAVAVNADNKNQCASLRQFLIQTLMWGNYDTIVGRYTRTISAQVVDSIPSFTNYSEIFIRNLNDANQSIRDKFNLFNTALNIPKVGYAYFTKFLHFYSHGNNQAVNMLILDKWAIYAWCALIIELNHAQRLPSLRRLLRYSIDDQRFTPKTVSGDLYQDYCENVTQISTSNHLAPNRFEELMFGWDLRQPRPGFTNPRTQILETLRTHSNLFL